ncbi:MAG: hypothetical protein A3C53_04450 [Omnitrophica WOR_2 bacterium RIFCSPHIGHO2_02_FULL_68_15]|nr:MAG: hypothetical protein A3C53_04450 [Omnitrophica WOR_2 bacterium RIFCSPHIGHO2_02_FULL_68_15]
MWRWLALGLILVASAAGSEDSPTRMHVTLPLLDVRAAPEPAKRDRDHDPLQETQLLYGEEVLVHETRDGWARIEAVEQPEWSHHGRWEGYPGWVEQRGLAEASSWEPNLTVTSKLGVIRNRPHSSGLVLLRCSLGTWLRVEDSSNDWQRIILLDGREGWIHARHTASLRAMQAMPTSSRRTWILQAARQFLGDPYYWGGRTAHDPGASSPPHTAVDCSGLVNLCYRAAGLIIPRDAHEQFLKAAPISLEQAQPADLVFLSSAKHPDRITHVMLYAGKGRVIEAPGAGGQVREVALEDKRLEAKDRRVTYGTLLE